LQGILKLLPIGVSDWWGLTLPVTCPSIRSQILLLRLCGEKKKTANSVESGVFSFDSALKESVKFLCELGMSRDLRTGQKDAIPNTGTGFGGINTD